ncbi:MAG: VOC family protein [Chloroflexi bacterium]|nr:VOC family protein [Chloroflexota bacterium]
MIRGIDHLVIACVDPNAAAAELESSLGIACGGGGRHPGLGTWNRIAWLADGSYLELMGVDDREAALQGPVGAAAVAVLDASGGGLATYALADDTLEVTASALRASGASIGPVTHGTRQRDDGEMVEWWTAFPDAPLAPDAPPFLIQHASVGSEWGHEALATRARYAHPIGSPVILARLDVATTDPPGAAAVLHEQLGFDLWAVSDLAVADVGPHVLRLVPRREMAVPAVITLGAEVEAPRTVELLGVRFDVERVALPVPAAAD